MKLITKNYLTKFNNKKRKMTKEQELADQIYTYFGKELKFGFIIRVIKMKGYQFIFECWNDVKQSNPKNAVSLFMWKIGQVKINFENKVKPTI